MRSITALRTITFALVLIGITGFIANDQVKAGVDAETVKEWIESNKTSK